MPPPFKRSHREITLNSLNDVRRAEKCQRKTVWWICYCAVRQRDNFGLWMGWKWEISKEKQIGQCSHGSHGSHAHTRKHPNPSDTMITKSFIQFFVELHSYRTLYDFFHHLRVKNWIKIAYENNYASSVVCVCVCASWWMAMDSGHRRRQFTFLLAFILSGSTGDDGGTISNGWQHGPS